MSSSGTNNNNINNVNSNSDNEPPPYLTVGTEVSAKFKGAFCEAKITKIERSIKCKLTLKSNSDQLTLTDSQLRQQNGQPLCLNDYKIGSTVYVTQSNSNSNLQPAILNKITDQSVYTVVFNDGDQKTMKRSFIRFKGEKHFLDSETLNNAPLNNPEHFLFPIKQEQNNNDEDDEDNVSVSSDECLPEERDRFVAQLYKFMDDRGTPMNKIPSINKTDLDLYKLFNKVKKMGGFNKVTKHRSWSDVYKQLNLPNASNAQNILSLKSAYERYLQPYEEISRKLGGNMIDYSAGSSSYVSKRSSSINNSLSSTSNEQMSSSTRTIFKRQVVQSTNLIPKKKQTKTNKNINVSAASPATTTASIETEANNLEVKETNEISDQQSNNVNSNSEELTLFSMVQNLNENYKKAKKEKLEKSNNINSEDEETNSKQPQQQSVKRAKGRQPNKIIVKSNSNDNKLSLNSAKIGTDSLSDNNNEEMDVGETSEDAGRSLKKKNANRLSVNDDSILASTSTAGNGRGGYKRKNSLQSTINMIKDEPKDNNNNESESNKESDKEIDQANNTDSEILNENDFKTILTLNDLEANKIVEVKYGTTSQKQQHIYRAKIVQINTDNQTILVHYLGWNNRYDEWIKLDRIIRMLNNDCSANTKRRKKNPVPSDINVNSQTATTLTAEQASSNQNETASVTSLSSSSSTIVKQQSSSSADESSQANCQKISLKSLDKRRHDSTSSNTSSITSTQNNENQTTEKNFNSEIKTRNSISSISTLPASISDVDKTATITCKPKEEEIEEIKKDNDNKDSTITTLLSIKKEIVEFYDQSNETTTQQIETETIEIEQKTTKTNKINKRNSSSKEPSITHKEEKEEQKCAKQTSNKISSIPSDSNAKNEFENTIEKDKENEDKHRIPEILNKNDIESTNKNIENDSNNNSTYSSINTKSNESITNKAENLTNLTNTTTATNSSNNSVTLNSDINTNSNNTGSKYSFHITNPNLHGKLRIRHIEEQMRLCREAYAKLKNEIAAIDRKKKKLKRDLLDKSTSNNNNNNDENNFNNLSTNKLMQQNDIKA